MGKISREPLELARAIDGLTEWQKHVQTDSNINRDITVAIEALKAQLGTNLAEVGTDCISRQAALDIFDDYNVAVENGQIEAYSRDRKRLCDLPPAQPEQHWIPVTERLPEKEKKSYWVCLESGGQCQCRWTNDIYGIGGGELSKWGWNIFDKPQYSRVVAWMPLPKAWEGDAE